MELVEFNNFLCMPTENVIHVIKATIRADRNPGRIQANPIVVSNGQTVHLAAVAIHATDKNFANASSLSLKWEMMDCDGLAYLDAVASLEIYTWEQFFILQNSTGLVCYLCFGQHNLFCLMIIVHFVYLGIIGVVKYVGSVQMQPN